MNGFKFKLQNVLDYKIRCENNLKKDYNKLMIEINNKKNEIKSLEEKLNNLKLQKNVFTTHVEFKNYINFLEYLTNKIDQENKVLKQLQKELEKISNELLKLNKDKKIIENLKEKEYKLFLNEVNRLEQLKIDEFSIINFYRTKGGNS
ncbi:flagellar export protein FliJ [Thermobrachium celere]|uniref:Flagellar FliJ protein n=1 Tax=Thermobrachium celere DSM 8682 TaxID=941824 RepID=R7RPC7_9CLOT|nr:flagellar export protein FliJ [Thermobrachium celere]CDF58017.1 hypothetical protein TCEL_01931 [Thermobrachium celere DSM 8682]